MSVHRLRIHRLRARRSALAAAALLALGTAPVQHSQAAACTFNPASGNWNVAANWSCGLVPSGPAGDSATVAAGKAVTVNDARSIFIFSQAGTLNLDAFTFSLQPGGSTTNTGTINVGGASTAALQMSHGIANTGGVIHIGSGSVLNQFAGSLVGGAVTIANGGTLSLIDGTIDGSAVTATGTGALVAGGSSSNKLANLTFNGRIDATTAGSQLRWSNVTLNGHADIGSGAVAYLDGMGGASTLGGTATVNLTSGSHLRVEGAHNQTLGSGTVVRGAGTFGQATLQSGASGTTLINNGRISADVNGGTLNIVPIANAGALTNNHVAEATGGGILQLSTSVVQGGAGRVTAQDNSVVMLNGSGILGGLVSTVGSGKIQSTNSSANVLSGLTVSGNVDLASSASQLRISDSLVLNGQVEVGGSSRLYVDNRSTSTQSIAGTGTVRLAGGSLHLEGTGQTTTGANVAVRGFGNIGQAILQSGAHTWVNDGLVSADVAGQTLQIVPLANGGQAVQNNGILEATNGGMLLLSTHVAAAPTSQLRANAGSTIQMNGVTVTGTVNTTGTGTFTATHNAANLLSGVTLNGTMDLASAASQLRIGDSLVLNGQVDVGGSSRLYLDNRSTPTQGITGTGTIRLAGGTLHMEGAGQTTTGANTAIRGFGHIGQGILQSGVHTWVSNGLVSADVSGQTLQIVPPANGGQAVRNNGTLQAANGGQLLLSASVLGGAASRLDVDGSSQILMNGVTLAGVVNQTGSGAIDVSNSFGNGLSGTSLSGRVNVGTVGGGQLRISDGMALNSGASINVGPLGALYLDNRGAADQTLGGNGQIALNGGTLRFEGGNSTTFDSGVTLRGSGNVGPAIVQSANHTFIHNGTILADGGVLTIAPIANAGALQGTGTLRVAGGTLALATGRTTNQGTLDIQGSGTISLGNPNLVLSRDYTNVQAGSGNSFNRRAGVTGAGQIQAGGDVSQVIHGAQVSNGNTPSATLTIGNVRVGSTTFNYQVGNAGTTGPTLRGAIQTSVNGGTLSDARLSGTGVTAANYHAGAPGGSSGDLGVTFTTATAGALAPLSGQVLNLRSNFENIPDQKLHIVLGSGAAAYHAAVGSVGSPVVIANQRVNGSTTATLAVANTAPAGAFSEDLHASVGSVSGPVSGSGTVTGRLAGSNNTGTGALTVGLATGSAGFKTGTVNVDFQTAGAVGGVSNGLGTASAGSQAVTVQGNVYQPAAGQLLGTALNFGTVQVGQSVSQNLVVRNTASGPGGFVEDLNVSFGPVTGTQGTSLILTSGALSGIVAGATSTGSNGTMTVGVNTASAGTVSGQVQVNYTSAGAVAGVSNGLAPVGVGSESFGVSGVIQTQANVVNQASPVIDNPVISLGAVRVGDAAPTAFVSVTNQATVAPQAALNASIGSGGSPFTASGSFSLLNPGATNAGHLQVGLSTATAGNFTGGNAGSATLSLVSDASNIGGCAPNCQLTLPSQQVTLSGKVYAPAVGQVATTVVDFGTVRVGDTPSARSITIHNTAAVAGLNDTLRADLSGVAGPFNHGGSAGGIPAQGSGSIAVNLSTAAAGVYSQTGSVSLLSQNGDMADASAGATAQVVVRGQVNRLANADFDLLSGLGTLTETHGHYVLTLNPLQVGQAATWLLQLDNEVSGPADHLRGSFDLGAADDFGLGGFSPVSDLAPGQAQGGLLLSFTAQAAGDYEDTLVFNGASFNDSDPTGLGFVRSLTVRLHVDDTGGGGGGNVPEPATPLLVLGALAAALRLRRRTPPNRLLENAA